MLIRPPGMESMVSRARALVAFLLEGLMAGHERGLVHGWLLPSLIVCDTLGRPMLGPFGGHHLAGLTATHTGGLEELLAVSAPGVQRGGEPTAASDLYALGVLLGALLTGSLAPLSDAAPRTPEFDLVRALCTPEAAERISARDALRILRTPIADIQDLGRIENEPSAERSTNSGRALDEGLVVVAAESWTDEVLDLLCQCGGAWMQPILDRDDRRFVLAPWPPGSRSLGPTIENWREFLDPHALELSSPELEAALDQRLRASSLVHVTGGAWMLALDDLLQR